MSDLSFAGAFEAISKIDPAHPVAICDDTVLTWGDYEQRSARLASAFGQLDFEQSQPKVGIYLHNCNEYLEAQFAAFKSGGASINVNYRYRAEELVYLLDNADVEVLVYHARYAEQVADIKDQLPRVKLYLQVDDDSDNAMPPFAIAYEEVIESHSPAAPRQQYDDSVYMIYTGGTTGMPKGVMYEQTYFCRKLWGSVALFQGLEPPQTVSDVTRFVEAVKEKPVVLCSCPLMHGTGMWIAALSSAMSGGTVVTTAKLGLDPARLLQLVAQHNVSEIVIVGDAFAKPLLAELDRARDAGEPYDLNSLKRITSSGVMWSQETKQGLLAHHDMQLFDRMGSSESAMGVSVSTRENTSGATARFSLAAGARVVNEQGKDVEPGSGEVGVIATNSLVPLCYYKDEAKSAATFKELDGERYSFPGDYATVEADGRITLLGRGSLCINTAGEKVFPEEVEEAVKKHPAISDCLVVGVPDEQFGERIVAVASLEDSKQVQQDEIIDFTKEHLAGYKAPRHLVVVADVPRAPNGKPDHKVAREHALKELEIA